MGKKLLTILLSVIFTSYSAGTPHGAELLMFESPACEWCDRWDEEIGVIYDRTEEGRVAPLQRFTIRQPLPVQYEFVTGTAFTPTFVLVDEGRELGRILGYPGEDHFWGLLAEMLDRQSVPQPTNDNAAPGT